MRANARKSLQILIWAIFPLISGKIPDALAEDVAIRVGAGADAIERNIGAGTGEAFRDCPEEAGCPQLVVVPAALQGSTIGSPESEPGRVDNEKQHRRTFKAFAIGRTEVSVAEYKRCMAASACPAPEWLEKGGQHNIETGSSLYYKNLGAAVTGDRQPIVGVSYDDATAYVRWLGALTGRSYRLPSEAEWEYAARAGAATAYWWGDEPNNPDGSARAACRGCGTSGNTSPQAVDGFAANPWGLYNVHGNVWEWTADFYCDEYASGPPDGSARTIDDCKVKDADNLRVLRGGSSFYGPDKMRAASRLRNFPAFRNFSVGFRVARSLE